MSEILNFFLATQLRLQFCTANCLKVKTRRSEFLWSSFEMYKCLMGRKQMALAWFFLIPHLRTYNIQRVGNFFFRQYWYPNKRSKFLYDWVEKTFQEILPIRILSKYYSSWIQLFVFCWYNDLQMYLVHSDTCNELCGYLFSCKKYWGIHKWWIAIWNWDINSFTKSKLGFCGLLF